MITSMMRRALLSGDGSTLNLDFTTGVLPSSLTFTRASTGTFINASGNVATASNNVPRFDHDPTTLAPRGLLIEGTASNIMFRSQAINTSPWFNAGTMTVSETGSGSPANDATSNVVTWTNGTGAGGAWLQQNVAVSAGSLVVGNAYTWSVWLKSRGGRRVNVFAVLQGATGNREVRVDFGVSPPTVTSTSTTGWTSIQAPTIVEHPNGWYKVTTGGTLPAGTTSVNFGFSNSDAVPASGTNGFEAWGYQLEAGSGASSYIPTGASTATRVEDSAIMTDVASLGFDQYQGTFLIRAYQTKQGTPGSFARSMRLAGSTQEPMGFIVNGVTLFGTSRNTSNTVIGETTRTNTLAQNFAFGFALDANDAAAAMRVSLNGSGTSAVRSATGPTQAATSFSLNTNGTATAYASLAVRSIKFWPVAKTLAELNALTTGG